jgi:hypothetical protein
MTLNGPQQKRARAAIFLAGRQFRKRFKASLRARATALNTVETLVRF